MRKTKGTTATHNQSVVDEDLDGIVTEVEATFAVNQTETVVDEGLDSAVADVETSAAADRPVQLVDLIGPASEGVLTLFPFTPRNPDAEKTYPVMTGYLDTRDVKVQVSAFLKMSDEGRKFLSLSIGKAGQDHIGGVLFRQENQDVATGLWETVPGKENERSGWIDKQVKNEESGEYETVFRLNANGSRRRSRAGAPFIKVRVYPVPVAQPADVDDMRDCF